VDAHMKNLRSKLGPLSGMIYTVRGVGYGVDPTAYAEA
jgi:DNA-binding response OmpR family regulator